MKLDAEYLKDLGFRLQEEGREVARIVKDKGVQHFQQPLIAAGLALFACYFLVYRATNSKLAALENQIFAEKSRAEHAEAYEALRARMLSYYARMPKPEVKDGWLFNQILESAKRQGIILDSISSQSEAGNNEVWILSIPVAAKLDYQRLGKWIENLENQKPGLYVTKLTVKRPEKAEQRELGSQTVSMEISTSIPKKVAKL